MLVPLCWHGLACRVLQALSKLAPHIQQVSMESNGKGVDIDGNVLPFEAGEGREHAAAAAAACRLSCAC